MLPLFNRATDYIHILKSVHFVVLCCVDFITLEHNQINECCFIVLCCERRSLNINFTNDSRSMIKHALSVIAEYKKKKLRPHAMQKQGWKNAFTITMHADLCVYLSAFPIAGNFKATLLISSSTSMC